MALDEIIAHLDKLTLAEASLWFVEHMTYVSPHRHAVYLYLCERRYSTC
jgi:hypothetical protein